MRRIIFSFFCTCSACFAHGQFLDLIRLEHVAVPGKTSNFEYHRTEFVFNYPFKVKEEAYFFLGFDYSNIEFQYRETIDSFDKQDTDHFTLVDLNLSYTFPLSNNWRFALQVSPGISSNFKTTSIGSRDLVFSSVVAFIKDMKESGSLTKPHRIIIGAAYSGNSGIPFPIPFVRYYRKFHPRWSFNIGAPVSNLQFHASERLRFKLFATLDGFNANLQRRQLLVSGATANRLRLNMILVGPRFEYKFSEHVESFCTITRSMHSVVQLRNGRERVSTFPADNVMHYRLGVRFKL